MPRPSSPEPEFWIEEVPDGDDWSAPAGDGAGTDASVRPAPSPPRGPRRWPRWAALAAGLVVIGGAIAWQGRGSDDGQSVEQPTAQTPTSATPTQTRATSTPNTATDSPPSTWAPTASEVITFSPGAPDGPVVIFVEPGTTMTGDWVSGAGAITIAPPSSAPPLTTTVTGLADPSALAAADWQLVGYGRGGVVRYTPATGELVSTPVPGLDSDGPLSVVMTGDATIIRPFDSVTGYLVPGDGAAAPLEGMLSQGGNVLPGPNPGTLWVVRTSVQTQGDGAPGTDSLNAPGIALHAQLVLVDIHGTPLGATIDVPDTEGLNPSYQIRPDGSGYALFTWVGGTYRLGPDGPHLVTHGQVLATGPTNYLIYECNESAQCGAVVLDRVNQQRRALPGFTLQSNYLPMGITSPDGHWAAVLDLNTMSTLLVDLDTGAYASPQRLGAYGGPQTGAGIAPLPAFSPDGRYLIIGNDTGVDLVHLDSGDVIDTVPLPHLTTIDVRPAG